jgi:hypothetical protein
VFLPYAVEDNIERKKTGVKCCLEVKTIFEGNLVFLYKIYTVSKKMCVEGFHTDRFLLLRTPFCIEILPHKQGIR